MTTLRVSIAAIRSGGRYFLQRRDPAAAVLPGLWELPGGKVEAGESPAQALLRELREELAWVPRRMERLPSWTNSVDEHGVDLNLFLCEGVSSPHTALAWGWFRPRELARLPMPPANHGLPGLLERLEKPF